MISYHLREENIFYLSKYFGGWKLTGVLWLYYMTICIIIKNKITIGLYIITPWCYLYYYAFFHTYNQQKFAKIWYNGPRCSGRAKLDICHDITSSKLIIQRVKRCYMPAEVFGASNFLDHQSIMDRGLGLPTAEFLNLSHYVVLSVDKKEIYVLLLYYFYGKFDYYI